MSVNQQPLWKRKRLAELVRKYPNVRIKDLAAELKIGWTTAQKWRSKAIASADWPNIDIPDRKTPKAIPDIGIPQPACRNCGHRRIHHFTPWRERIKRGEEPAYVVVKRDQAGDYLELPLRCAVDTDDPKRRPCGCMAYQPALTTVS